LAGRSRSAKQFREEQRYASAFRRFLYYGDRGLTPEEKRLIATRDVSGGGGLTSTGGAFPGSGSGYLVPAQFFDQVFAMMKATDDLFSEDAVTRIDTPRGGPASIPNMDDTTSSATLVTQATTSTETEPAALGQLSFPTAPTWRSGIVKVSIELDQDSAIPLDTLLARSFAVRFARGIGSNNVSVLLAAAELGATATGSASNDGGAGTGANSVGSDDLFALMASVDPAYIASPKCAWAMSYATLIAIDKLKDKQGRPLKLVRRNEQTGEIELLFKPVRICPSMPSIGTGNKCVAFGDFSRFIVRGVQGGLRVLRLEERYAEFGQIAFEAFLRSDAGLQRTLDVVSPTTYADSPVKYLANS
jgi:HK97 family phage major capsid protein